MNVPEIRINFSELLYGFALSKFANNMGEELPIEDDCYKWTASYRYQWSKYEKRLVEGMLEVLDVEFYRGVIDVSTAPFFIPQSDPLIINFRNMPDHFVDVLTHELLHVLLTDNNKVRIRDEKPALNLVDEWQKLFGKEHDFSTLVHIPVQALMKYLYLDVLNEPYRLERDIQGSSKLSNAHAYINSWEYVSDNDYKKIIKQLKQSYVAVS